MSVRTVVIGLGNPLMSDDGIGLAALQLVREWDIAPEVDLVDGGTWGMQLLPAIEDAGRLLFLDAINTGACPGTLTRLSREELPRFLETKVSPHQVDLKDALAVAEFRGRLPHETVAIGIQPATVALGMDVSPAAGAALVTMLAAVRRQLETWGHRVTVNAEAPASA
ncbi:MAG TPA: HyaD/HybD family hydrogenase maturation endopeptidase [Gemmatimonadales bacterium]|nr:HyaD/HybD family hydrogenase maturation endopeptidase [Gemmatimonadales bacterium]